MSTENFIQEPAQETTTSAPEIVIDTSGAVIYNAEPTQVETLQTSHNPETTKVDAGDIEPWLAIGGLLTIITSPYIIRALRNRNQVQR